MLCVLGLYAFETVEGGLQYPCLFAIDEMPSLGYSEAIETAPKLMRGFGVRLLVVTQDIQKGIGV